MSVWCWRWRLSNCWSRLLISFFSLEERRGGNGGSEGERERGRKGGREEGSGGRE